MRPAEQVLILSRAGVRRAGVRKIARESVLACGALLILCLPARPATAASPRLLAERILPQELRWAQDVRWAGPDSVFVAAGKAGVVEVSLQPTGRASTVITGGTKAEDFWFSARLAGSGDHLLVAAPVGDLTWKDKGGPLAAPQPFAAIVDVDAAKGHLVVLGARRERDQFSPDGAVAWYGSLKEGLPDLKPILYSRQGSGARPMDACGVLELGAVRFLPNGSFVVIPGVEPGVFLYDANGKMRQTWETTALGFYTGCDITEAQMYLFSQSPKQRSAWVNQRRVLDDIVPLPEGPGLLVRTFAGGRTTWQIKVLGLTGGTATYDVPVESPSPYSHLRADVNGDRMVFLQLEYGPADTFPAAWPRLIVTSLPR